MNFGRIFKLFIVVDAREQTRVRAFAPSDNVKLMRVADKGCAIQEGGDNEVDVALHNDGNPVAKRDQHIRLVTEHCDNPRSNDSPEERPEAIAHLATQQVVAHHDGEDRNARNEGGDVP